MKNIKYKITLRVTQRYEPFHAEKTNNFLITFLMSSVTVILLAVCTLIGFSLQCLCFFHVLVHGAGIERGVLWAECNTDWALIWSLSLSPLGSNFPLTYNCIVLFLILVFIYTSPDTHKYYISNNIFSKPGLEYSHEEGKMGKIWLLYLNSEKQPWLSSE